MYLSEAEKASSRQKDMKTLRGKGNHAGSAVGRTVFFSPHRRHEVKKEEIDKAVELERYFSAHHAVTELLRRQYGTLRSESDSAWIFLMQITLLSDDLFSNLPRLYLSEGKSAEETVALCRDYFFSVLCRGAGGEHLSVIALDVEDVVTRLIEALSENPNETALPQRSILLTREPLPSYIAELRSSLVGIVAASNEDTSHSSLLSHSLGIPFISTDEELPEALAERNALIDSNRGYLYIDPDLATLASFSDAAAIRRNEEKKNIELTEKPIFDREGKKIVLLAELDRIGEMRSGLSSICDGIGKFSSEELYLEGMCPPDEELLFDTYRRAAEAMPTKPVIIRAFRTSGGVHLNSIISGSDEEAHGELYVTYDTTLRNQLRAVMRAAAYGALCFCLPSTALYSDIFTCASLMEELSSELYDEEREFNPVPLGTIVDDVASALMCNKLFEECDFLIIKLEKLAESLSLNDTLSFSDQEDNVALDALLFLLKNIQLTAQKKKKKLILSLGKNDSLEGITPDIVNGFSFISASPEQLSKIKKRWQK